MTAVTDPVRAVTDAVPGLDSRSRELALARQVVDLRETLTEAYGAVAAADRRRDLIASDAANAERALRCRLAAAWCVQLTLAAALAEAGRTISARDARLEQVCAELEDVTEANVTLRELLENAEQARDDAGRQLDDAARVAGGA